MKYVVFSDIHFGLKQNSKDHNQQCLDFLDFVYDYVDKYLANDDKYAGTIFMGDFFHNRNSINVSTLKYGVEGIYSLGRIGHGKPVYMLIGNHDLYYLNQRDVHSIVIPEGDIGVEVIDEPIYLDKEKILLCPWLVGDESLKGLIEEYNPQYVFGHFELPSFKLNQKVIMQGDFDPQDYAGPKRILSGHFHCRNEKNNITYMGNCFSHDFSDANDWHNKGFAIFDTETNEIEYHEWIDAPKYATSKLSKVNTIEIGSNMNIKIVNDTNMSVMDINKFKEEMEKIPQIKEIYIIPQNVEENLESEESTELENIEDINTFIMSLLNDLDMENIDSSKLVEIYRDL